MYRREFLGRSAAAAGLVAANGFLPARAETAIDPPERDKVERAVPAKALVPPGKPRKLLIFDLNVGYGGHRSIPYANLAFTRMGQKTGAFEAVVSRDPAVFGRAQLGQFDAVFFNNTVGNLFEDPELRRNLLEFVYGGGGLLGIHGTSVAFTRWPGAHEDWPEFGIMLGARGANHRDSDEHVFIKLDDPDHPVCQTFGGKGFDYRDEFFRVHEPYSRNRVRVLLSIDTEKKDPNQGLARGNCFREDNDYALAWLRQYGRGRVFYCTIAHNPYVFWDPRMLQFYLAAIQFALGDLPGPTTPSNKLTPPVRVQERLGWRLGVGATVFGRYTLFEAIDKIAELGVSYMGGLGYEKVSEEISGSFDPGLSDAHIERIRLKLDSAGVRLVTYDIPGIPGDDAGLRKLFEFGRKTGVETFISEPALESLDRIERFCDEYDIRLAVDHRGKGRSADDRHPKQILEVCQGRGPRIGACGDLGDWMRSGVDPVEAANMLGDRLITLRIHDLDAPGRQGRDVPWGTGAGRIEQFLMELKRLGIRPSIFGLVYPCDRPAFMEEMARCVDFFNRVTLQLPT